MRLKLLIYAPLENQPYSHGKCINKNSVTIFYNFKVSYRSAYTQGKVIHKGIYTQKQEPQGSFYRGAVTGDHDKMNKLIMHKELILRE